MSVTSQVPYKKYTAAPAAVLFSTTFRVLRATDLEVRVNDVVVTSGFTLSALGGASVDVTFSAPKVGGEKVELQRKTPLTRSTDYQQLGDFQTPVVNADFDRLWMASQEMTEQIERSIRVPIGSGIDPDQLIADLTQASIDSVAAADAAAISETNAAASAATASAAAASATTSASTASTAATSATGSASAASTSATSAASSASAASTSASGASTSATTASTAATNAGNSATAAATSATNAGNSATAAGTSATNAAASAAAAAASAAAVSVKPSFRQTVLEGPVDSSGYPNFGGAVGTATLTATGTLKATAAAGGESNYTGSVTNPAWTSPSGTGTGFLMLAITSAGVVTTSVRTLRPAWQFGGTYSTTTDQLTFNEQEATMKAGGGGVATQVYEVCVGECPYTSSVWSGTIIWYQLKAEYDNIFAVSANALYAKNANVGGPCDLFLFFSTSATGINGGTNEEVPYGGPGDGPNTNYRGCLFGQSTQNVIRARTQDIFQIMDASGASSNPSSGYCRLRARRRFR